MALFKDLAPQSSVFAQGLRPSSLGEEGCSEKNPLGFLPVFFDPLSNSRGSSIPLQEAHPVPNFKSSVLSFEQNSMSGSNITEEKFGILYMRRSYVDGLQGSSGHKRSLVGGEMQASKKHCCSFAKEGKGKANPSKDPQSIAAKNRRERISERLKILQELVPNGTKVDLVTMLEKAISYVKFLQLQIKVLATDEFWPAQGGKAPELSQVKEAFDAILSSSHGERNSITKN
ncbi:hypothetical protein HPP92_004872 [Vanilla planifolia]|uniref:BHLH domain-containing protein n=1 Tax=Vanilla planifolia TaxID=51239 RepID=A0A835RLW8_VANPL|nr:hypothetical protein HPP92_004872 [Vanilla planifolia]